MLNWNRISFTSRFSLIYCLFFLKIRQWLWEPPRLLHMVTSVWIITGDASLCATSALHLHAVVQPVGMQHAARAPCVTAPRLAVESLPHCSWLSTLTGTGGHSYQQTHDAKNQDSPRRDSRDKSSLTVGSVIGLHEELMPGALLASHSSVWAHSSSSTPLKCSTYKASLFPLHQNSPFFLLKLKK